MKQEYIQCKLERPGKGFTHTQVSFLPKEFAVKNKVLKLKNDDGKWTDGWIVAQVFKDSKTSVIPDSHVAIKRHRNRTGDSMPKVNK